jgi:hypothetical protein
MHAFIRTKRAGWAALVGLLLVLSSAATAWAKPAPGYRNTGFRLFSRVTSAIGGNRVSCGLIGDGRVCVDSTGSSVAGGGFWPRGTLNQYVFNSGLQLAGVIDSQAPMSWAGTTEGAFFFNARGGANGTALTNVYRSSDPDDAAHWPEVAKVPKGDATADLFAASLQGQIHASDQDVWFLSWEGDPNRLSGRQHTLGIMTETRGMAFATAGKEDFVFFIYTLYNITCDGSKNAACYAAEAGRPAMQDTLNAVSARYAASNTAKFGEAIPVNGYRIQGMYAAFGADNDVTVEASGNNYDGVNVPMALGYTYHESFVAEPSWKFDPTIYHAPFFPGAGFIGVKYLKSPVVNGQEVGLSLFGATTNGGQFSDPQDTKALYRYLSGTNSAAFGDDICNVGDVAVTHICFINQGSSADMRFFQSSGPLTLNPGESSSIVVAYIFAPPVAVGGCPVASCQSSIPPQQPTNDLTRFLSPASIVLGVNTVDSMTGYKGYSGDLNANNKVDQDELQVVPGSLLGKGITAQAVFDSKFAQPQSPDAPTFYLLPGDKQVTVLWQASPSETNGDSYFSTAQNPATFDPNYRQKDVLGYRVYRGLTNDPSSYKMLAQYHYTSGAPVTFTDFTGQVNAGDESQCVPDLGIFISCTSAGPVNGVNTIDPVDHDVVAEGRLVQATGYAALLNGNGLVTTADTMLTGKANAAVCGQSSPCPALDPAGGVPFVYVDNTVANNHTYFYSVTAFDMNSIRSGPSSLESARLTKVIVPSPAPVGTVADHSLAFQTVGRGLVLPAGADPTLDPVTGEFSGPQQPFNGAEASFVGQFVSQLFQGANTIDITLKDIDMGDARFGTPVVYTFTVTGPKDTLTVPMSIFQTTGGIASGGSGPLAVAPVDPGLAAKAGVDPNLKSSIQFTSSLDAYQVTNSQGRGCADGAVSPPASAPGCQFYGPRWFDGANESTANPNAGNDPAGSTASNAGAVAGVVRIQWPSSFANFGNGWRQADASLGGFIRAADMKFYWGTAGKVDSVIDVTHNVVVPFTPNKLGGGWGILTTAASAGAGSFDTRPGVVTIADFGCVEPAFSDGGNLLGFPATVFCGAAAPYLMVDSAVAGPVAFGGTGGATGSLASAPPAANPGFAIWVAGEMFTIELAPGAAVPSNTVWTLRSYIGSIFQTGAGAFVFSTSPVRTFSALGATLRVAYTANNKVVPPTGPEGSVANVHTVPDPYYVTSSLETTTDKKVIKFVNLPPQANIRIYTSSGILVRVLQHNSTSSNAEDWDIRNRNNQFVASGVYFYSVEDAHTGIRKTGRMTVINFTR